MNAAKRRYRTDADYRAKILARNKAYQDRHQKDPLFKRLTATRKKIYKVRESYEARLAHARQLFLKLERLIKTRGRLEKEWKERKKIAV